MMEQELIAALNRIADGLFAIARATAGDESEEADDLATDLTGRPLR